MQNIKKALPEDFEIIAQYQSRMAKQTENIELIKSLITDGVEFIYQNKQYGQYLIYVDPQTKTPLGLISFMIENEEDWWVISTYVLPQHRKKGVFPLLYQKVKTLAKVSKAKKLKIMTQSSNIKAKQSFLKKGMHCTQQMFFGFEFVYAQDIQLQNFQMKIQPSLIFHKNYPQDQVILKQISKVVGSAQFKNKNIVCLQQQKLVGFCEFYDEFCVWRNGVILCITALYVAKDKHKQIIQNILRFLYQKGQKKLGSLRFCLKAPEDKEILKYCEKGKMFHYSILINDL